MDRQIDHLANYPEISDMLRRHRVETEEQIRRLDEILAGFDETPSKLKDLSLTLSGNMAAIAHVFAPDEVVKNSFANHAFENFEAAAYTSLITLADAGSFATATPLLQQSLAEEQRMAAWVLENIPRHHAEVRPAARGRRDRGPLTRAEAGRAKPLARPDHSPFMALRSPTLPPWTIAAPGLGLLAVLTGLAGRGTAGVAIAVAILMASVIAAVHHAEVVAHRVGEPFGTLVLAVAVTVIEVSLIVT